MQSLHKETMKYVGTAIMFKEVPDEISLGISISGCSIRCEECHSKYLWENIGVPLTIKELYSIIEKNKKYPISCICFMGGELFDIKALCKAIKQKYPQYKTAWYTGRQIDVKHNEFVQNNFDYIKTGPFIKELGGLDSENTNQRMYKKEGLTFKDITKLFQKHETD